MEEQSGVFGSFGLISFGATTQDGSVPLPSSAEMRACDNDTIVRGTPSLELMTRAARACVDLVRSRFPHAVNIVVLCGPGNNGGDGLEIASQLTALGCNATVIASTATRYSSEWRDMAARVKKILFFPAVPRTELTNLPTFQVDIVGITELKSIVEGSDLLIDAMLGIGQFEAPRGAIGDLLRTLEVVRLPPVCAVDIPTGVNADTGEIFSPSMSATITVAVQAAKRGVLQFPGRKLCGEIVVKDIGISVSPPGNDGSVIEFSGYLGADDAELLYLAPDAHKGNRGHVLVIGGSKDMPGAPALTARAALRAGAGLVTVVSRGSWDTFSYLPPEVMRITIAGESEAFGPNDVGSLRADLSSFDAVVLGPGLGSAERYEGVRDFTYAVLHEAIRQSVPVVLDASALGHMVGRDFPSDSSKIVITPHPGEAANLLQLPVCDVQRDRFAAVKKLSSVTGAAAILKGAGTLVYQGSSGYLIPRGTPYLATAGSGDVLAGIVSVYLARGISPVRAACAAVVRHAVAGEEAARRMGSFIASDLIEYLAFDRSVYRT